jgi:hypothetical protein
MLRTDDDEELAAIAMRDWNLDEAHARALARTSLPEGYAAIGRTAMARAWVARSNMISGPYYDQSLL